MIARRVVDEKLDTLRRCVLRLRAKTPASLAVLESDEDLQDVLVMALVRAVQARVDIATHLTAEERAVPTTVRDAFAELAVRGAISRPTAERLALAVGFRNLAVHAYDAIDWSIVHGVCRASLDDLTSFAREIDAYVTAADDGTAGDGTR